MKKVAYILMLLFITSISLTGCREKTPGEKVEDGIEEGAEEIEDEIDDATD